jgi:hypothetical protein
VCINLKKKIVQDVKIQIKIAFCLFSGNENRKFMGKKIEKILTQYLFFFKDTKRT